MAILLADILLGLVVEHDDLLGLAVLNHLGCSLLVFYYGVAYGDVLSVCYQQNVKADICADLCVQFFYRDNVADLCLILFTTGLNDCVHGCFLLLPRLAQIR